MKNAHPLAGLEPESVFTYFSQLCAIPHGSGNTKAISDFLVSFAQAHGIACRQDELNNVIFFQPGTPGYEDRPPVILQGHMDMVCAQDPDCPKDMAAEGLDVTHDGKFVFAKGTSLGGDDGIAVAYAMALLTATDLPHPPLEILITVDEETGMFGAAGVDLSDFRGRRMLNLDSEDEGVFTVSCAGGARAAVSLPTPRRAVYGPCLRLTVEGLRGGHSGVEINRNRANANKAMGLLLARVREKMPICLTSLTGGDKDNAIPQSCVATLVAMGTDLEAVNALTEDLQRELRAQYDEPGATVSGENLEALGGNALSTADTEKVIRFLTEAPHGVYAMCPDLPELVQTSDNLASLRLGDTFEVRFSVRSSVEAEKQALLDKIRSLAEELGASFQASGEYPAWEYRAESPLREKLVAVYTRLYGQAPQVVAIHAGLECGLLGKKLPGLDCVSLGPQMHDIHASREKLDIASVARTWDLLKAVLKEL